MPVSVQEYVFWLQITVSDAHDELIVDNIWTLSVLWRSLILFGETWRNNNADQTKKSIDIFHVAARQIFQLEIHSQDHHVGISGERDS